MVEDSSSPGMAAVAAVVRHPVSQAPIGVLSIAGPLLRLDAARMHRLAPALLAAAAELSAGAQASPAFALAAE
ncbi:IclR family transcriptional regulator C-terminal domain-containing protein [Siccirubricoccus deserti]